MKRILYLFMTACLFAVPIDLRAQLSQREINKIDSLFLSWNRPNHPGGSIGIMKDGKLVFSRAYGLASLEYLVPNTTDTRYNIASVSKQFTCMGIVLLDLQDKLSIEDDIRKYLPELPEFEEKITIRHLIHHTSGLRSLHALLGLAGWRGDDSRTNEDLFRLLTKQQALNFQPGAEHLYCNSGYLLMADIIEQVTGEKFADWMYNHVFEPLGMLHTYVEDRYNRVVPNNATSYYPVDGSDFARSVEYWGYVGAGNMHSTTGDLLKWMNNYYHPQPGWERPFQMMQTKGILNNGDSLDYAFGVVLDDFKGEKRLQHGGAIGGYRSFVQAFPEHELNIVILTNFSSSDIGSKSSAMVDLLLSPVAVDEEEGETDWEAIDLSREELESFCGHYWNEAKRYARKIYLDEDTLRYYRPESSESRLVPVAENSFKMLDVSVDLTVGFEGKGDQKVMIVQIGEQDPIRSEYYDPPEINPAFLNTYTGKYYSPELETQYSFHVQGDSTLVACHTRHGEIRIEVIREDDLQGRHWSFNRIRVKRDEEGNILGIYVSNGRVRNLWFEKI